jgi:hypothetical protein
MSQKFKAFDAETGKELWQTTLVGNISVSTITYAVKGKQYVAVMTGTTPRFRNCRERFRNSTHQNTTRSTFSVCRRFRDCLRLRWAPGPRVACMLRREPRRMQNPSYEYLRNFESRQK